MGSIRLSHCCALLTPILLCSHQICVQKLHAGASVDDTLALISTAEEKVELEEARRAGMSAALSSQMASAADENATDEVCTGKTSLGPV